MSFLPTPSASEPTLSNSIARLPRNALTIHPLVLPAKWELKKLSQKHKSIIALHAQGVRREDIGSACGCTPEYVSMIVAQPLAKEYLRGLEQYMDSRLRTLYGKSVDVIDKGLESDNPETALKAARLQMEATGKLKAEKEGSQTAEDVVAALLAHARSGGVVAIGTNVQVNTTPAVETEEP